MYKSGSNIKKGSMIALIIVPIVVYLFFFKNTRLEIDPSIVQLVSVENLVGIVAILSGITGIIMGVASAKHASLEAVREYFQQGDAQEYVIARKKIRSSNKKDLKSEDISTVCNFFHFWGLMVRKGYLPLWVFEGSSGVAVKELYEKLEEIIKEKRKSNVFYADNFEWLYYKILKKYKRSIGLYLQYEKSYKEASKQKGNKNNKKNSTTQTM